jgi:hypothetical protein
VRGEGEGAGRGGERGRVGVGEAATHVRHERARDRARASGLGAGGHGRWGVLGVRRKWGGWTGGGACDMPGRSAPPLLDERRQALQQHGHDGAVEVGPDRCRLQIHLVLHRHRRLLRGLALGASATPSASESEEPRSRRERCDAGAGWLAGWLAGAPPRGHRSRRPSRAARTCLAPAPLGSARPPYSTPTCEAEGRGRGLALGVDAHNVRVRRSVAAAKRSGRVRGARRPVCARRAWCGERLVAREAKLCTCTCALPLSLYCTCTCG